MCLILAVYRFSVRRLCLKAYGKYERQFAFTRGCCQDRSAPGALLTEQDYKGIGFLAFEVSSILRAGL
jgi:hypothetical protein